MEESFGIIPLRRTDKGWETLLVKHKKGHWAFPKGHPDEGESPQEAACRELAEETALRIVRFLPLDPLKESYHFQRDNSLIEKRVAYFLAEVGGEVVIQEEEIETSRWLSFHEAGQLATFPESKRLCREAGAISSRLS